jgi:hypothetical protein
MKQLKLIFASLFNNGVVMDGAKQPWYVAVIIFLLSMVLATSPTYNQIANQDGSDFLNGTLFSIDNGLQVFSETLDEEGIDLVVRQTTINDEERIELAHDGTSWETTFDALTVGTSSFDAFEFNVNNELRLRVFYQGSQTDEAATTFINELTALPAGDANIGTFMFLARTSLYIYMYNPLSVANGSSSGADYISGFSGTYDSVPLGTNLASFISQDLEGNFVDPASQSTDYQAYADRVFANWKQFFDQSYAFSRNFLLWAQTGLTFAVNIIMSLMMSVVIFIMTRGKSNPNKSMKFGEAMKIGAWSLLTPAILTIVAGGLFPEFAPTAFVLFVGLRLMWLSSKYLRPLDPTVPVKK